MRLFSAVLLLILIGCKADPRAENSSVDSGYSAQFDLQIGDFLFQDLDCGPFCDAIEAVTHGVNGADFSHNGLVSRIDGDDVFVLEAISAGVVETPLDSFLMRSADEDGYPKTIVGRLDSTAHHLVPMAIDSARLRLGKGYDHVFNVMNDDYYCSELIYHAFKEANNGIPIFNLRPMTYNDPKTGLPFPQWVTYFEELKAPIPENQPGLNPGSMSRNRALDIVHTYGTPTGWRGVR